jgi:lipid-A-disaccharide synthase
LLREFKQRHSSAQSFGAGGDRMDEQGCEILYHIRDISFLGLVEVIRHLPFIRRMMDSLINACRQRQPQAIVLVDYPGFNLHFARRLRKAPDTKHIPILYYISPQVWAWHASRVQAIARLVDRMAVIFDFEAEIYRAAGLRADFVGHPLLEVAQPAQTKESFRREIGVPDEAPLIALLPGSRKQEVRRLFPLFARTFVELRARIPTLQCLVGCSPMLTETFYEHTLAEAGLTTSGLRLLFGKTYDLLASSQVALAASGTVTLEAAIIGTPLVMAYRVAPLTYWIGRRLVKIPDIALVNVVAGRRVVPEFIQRAATERRLADELYGLLTDAERRQKMVADLAQVRDKLGTPGASFRVAVLLDEMIEEAKSRAQAV